MKLYHFTIPENLWLISLRGLEPGIHRKGTPDDCAWQTMGQPVVWLTRQETNKATAAEVAHMRALGKFTETELEFFATHGTFGGPCRLTVNVERHNKRLVRYVDFLRTTDLAAAHPDTLEILETGRDLLERCRERYIPSVFEKWWIYLGTIAPRKIEMNLTVAHALAGINLQIENRKGQHDAEGIARFKEMRDQLTNMPPDHPVHFSEAA